MTGSQFFAALKRAGFTQSSFAEVMGVDRGRIVRRCSSAIVEPYWVYALAGVIAEAVSSQLTGFSKQQND